jgi:hypothetical protein
MNRSFLTYKLLGLCLVGVVSTLTVHACDKVKASDQPTLMLAIPSVGMLGQIGQSEPSIIIKNYIQAQIATNGLTEQQFLALRVDQQKQVLAPGRQFMVSPEERRSIVPNRISVPENVQATVKQNALLSKDIITQYAVPIPTSASEGHQTTGTMYLLLGKKLVLVDLTGKVLDVTTNIL